MTTRIALILAAACTASFAGVRSGKVEADWLSASKTYTAGKEVQSAIRLVVDEGWHTYWQNPGEGGMKISAVWELPAGWMAGELEQPVPKRFMTGELPGFGYEKEVILPVKLTPPAGVSGPAKLKGKISWLTCNDEQCLPGEAELELVLDAGAPLATADVKVIEEALKKIPQPQAGWVDLRVTEKEKVLMLAVEANASRAKDLDLKDCEVFPATPETIANSAKIQFTQQGAEWIAEVPKSEYVTKPVEKLTLVLAWKSGQAPISLSWQKNQGKAISESPEPMKRP